jgi:hypothetical protein
MSDLAGVGFEDAHTAFEMPAAPARLRKEYLIDMEGVAVVTESNPFRLDPIASGPLSCPEVDVSNRSLCQKQLKR